MGRNTGKNTKQTKKVKKNGNKTKKMRTNKGGEYLGKGTYGSVYGNPRLPCQDEKYEDIEDKNEISKITKIQKDLTGKALPEYTQTATIEYSSVKRLNTKIYETLSENDLSPEDFIEIRDEILEDFQKYLLLPIKKCSIKENTIDNPPYNTVKWKVSSAKEKYNDTIFTGLSDIQQEWKNNFEKNWEMIIYPKGSLDGLQYMNSMRTVNDFLERLDSLLNVCKGIQLLQRYDMMHGDLKLMNTILHDNTLKMIDLETLGDITKITKDKKEFLSSSFTYFAFPSIIALSHKDKVNLITEKLFGSILQNDTVKQYSVKNTEEIDNIITNNEYKVNGFAILQGLTFLVEGEKNKKKLSEFSKTLISQAFFGMEFDNIRNYSQDIDKTEKYKEILAIMKIYNDIFISSQDVDKFLKDFKYISGDILDFYKRIDIYSFGIMLLQSMDIAMKKKILTSNMSQKIIELSEIAYRCCIQKERCESIDDIVIDFENILKKPTELPEIVSPDKKRRKEVSESKKTPTLTDAKSKLIFPRFSPLQM